LTLDYTLEIITFTISIINYLYQIKSIFFGCILSFNIYYNWAKNKLLLCIFFTRSPCSKTIFAVFVKKDIKDFVTRCCHYSITI